MPVGRVETGVIKPGMVVTFAPVQLSTEQFGTDVVEFPDTQFRIFCTPLWFLGILVNIFHMLPEINHMLGRKGAFFANAWYDLFMNIFHVFLQVAIG